MKKLLALVAVMGGAFTLSGCELNNEEMQNVISKCKEDTACKAILDKEIDEALAERGIFGYDQEGMTSYDVFYDLDLTEEEQALLETSEALDKELWEKLEGMSDEELEALEVKEMEAYLGRALTEEEKTAINLVDALYESLEIVEETFETEQEYLEFYLGRTLTAEEVAALETIEAVFQAEENNETVDLELTPEQVAAFDLIDALYVQAFEMSEVQELELLLGRQLTAEEQTALDTIDAVASASTDEEVELTAEQVDAFDLIDALYTEAYENYEVFALETMLGRALTAEEQAALDTVSNLWTTMDENFDHESEDAYIQETIAYYELILDRQLTDAEKEAVEFSLDFWFYDDYDMYDDMEYDDFDFDFDFDDLDDDDYEDDEE